MSHVTRLPARLSLSWTRIVPGGFKGSPINPEGIKFYKQLLQGLRCVLLAGLLDKFQAEDL